MKEKWLLHKIRHGDMAALDTFITQVYPTIYAFVYRKMQGDDSAKDITQEVFLRFIRYLPTYHEEGKVIHFLYRIASNLCGCLSQTKTTPYGRQRGLDEWSGG